MALAVVTAFMMIVPLASSGRPVFPEEINEIIAHLHHVCLEKTGTTEEDIANCENGIFKDDPKLKCYMFCLMEEASIADENGNMDYDMMIGMIPDEWQNKVSIMINACKHLDVPGKNNCEKTFEVHKCCYQQDPDFERRKKICEWHGGGEVGVFKHNSLYI